MASVADPVAGEHPAVEALASTRVVPLGSTERVRSVDVLRGVAV
jgi:hypothetical protein